MSDFMLKTFYKQRNEFEQMAAERLKNLPFPDNIEMYPNITYLPGSDCPAHRMDIYRPSGRAGEVLPVIINIHGGGMILGNKEFNRSFCAQLSQMGFLVFCVEFRLVPEVTMLDQFADLSAAMETIKNLIPKYNGTPDCVYMVGDSGGACLAVYTAAMQHSESVASAARVTPSSLNIRALGLISGMFYTTKPDKIGLFLPNYLYGKGYKKQAFAPYTNPEHPDIITALPPCCLITSHNDNLQHYTLRFADALKRHDIPHKLVNYPKNAQLTHAFCTFYPFLDESKEAITNMISFLRNY